MKEKDELLDHNYDGIEEYDNDLPRWWLALFWGGIIFGFIYVGFFHYGSGSFTTDLIASEMEKIEAMKVAAKAAEPQEEAGGESLIQLASNTEALAAGKELYVAKCAACHLEQGQGLVGSNLTDDYWIHGGSIEDIKRIIVEGVLEKGMIAWGPLMKPLEVDQVTAYVWSLHGTNPPNPKAPQGELMKRVGDSVEPAAKSEEAGSNDGETQKEEAMEG